MWVCFPLIDLCTGKTTNMKFDDHDDLSNEEFNSDEDKYKEDRGKPALFEHTESGIWTEVISRRRAIVKNTNMYQHNSHYLYQS